jgi:hypothetical protein
MSSTYSNNLTLELIGTGDQAGNWGATTNVNLGTLLEQAISGYVSVTVSADVTLSMTNGVDATARNMFLQLTGTGGFTLNVPNNRKLYFIYNSTAASVTVKVTGLTGVAVPAGAKVVLVCNGTDIVSATNYMVSLTAGAITGPLTGNVTGNVAGNVTGDLTGNVVLGGTKTITTTGFTIQESGGKLIFKNGATTIASLDASGNFVALANVTAYGTP